MATNLTKLSSLKVATLMLDSCHILIMLNDFKDNWDEFKDFIKTFKKYKDASKMLHSVLFVLKNAKND
jgi:hypothetical protein